MKVLLPTPHGSTLLAQNIKLLCELCGQAPLLSTNNPDLFQEQAGLARCIADEKAAIGPLAGFVAALTATRAEALVFVAGDMPFLTLTVLQSFVTEFEQSNAMGLWAKHNGYPQPFPSILSTQALEPLQEAVSRGEHSLQKVFSRHLSLKFWSEDSKRALDQTGQSFNNINDLADLERYLGQPSADVLNRLRQIQQ